MAIFENRAKWGILRANYSAVFGHYGEIWVIGILGVFEKWGIGINLVLQKREMRGNENMKNGK